MGELKTSAGEVLSDREFEQIQRFMRAATGIHIAPGKRALVIGRLARHLREAEFETYAEYLKVLASGQSPEEEQETVDLLTTNETYFFREPKHFDHLRSLALEAKKASRGLRVWSAACSSGEEVYSIAMVLEDVLGGLPWQVVGSDVSRRVLKRAVLGLYPISRTKDIPLAYLKRFCLRGIGEQEGNLLVEKNLRKKVDIHHVNLHAPLPMLGTFDVIFLRNVLIYFYVETRREVVARVVSRLEPGGYLFIGHAESLADTSGAVELVAPAIYRKP